ncbi:MAG TPA: hypothetical protein VM869_01690, partial [Enhygromyxa sp.]|nr:hypothetical protein [Enhygromyxa sp.]
SQQDDERARAWHRLSLAWYVPPDMARVLVIGGFGFYGRKVAELLRRDHEVVVGSRRPGQAGAIELDLARPETFTNLAGFDLLVNCSDSVNAAPDAAILHTLAHGGTWLEMGADTKSTERLLALVPPTSCKGTAIIGVGVFPGISTTLVRAVIERGPACSSIELGIRLSPLSGAGPANCALMAESLFVPAIHRRDGTRVEEATALGSTVQLPYLRDGELLLAPSVVTALPDTVLMLASFAVPNAAVHFALVPSWLRFNFAILARMTRWFRFAKRPLAWLITWQMIILRAWLLRGVESRVEMIAVADRGTASERSCALSFVDGQTATALGVAAAVHAWMGEPEHRAGVFGIANYFSLDQLLTGLEHHGQRPPMRWSGG